MRKCCCRHKSTVCDLYSVKYLITLLQSTKNGNGILHSRLINHNRLETTFQSSILFNILTILVQGGCSDTVKFPSCKHWLQHISRIHGAVCFSCSDDQMKLVNKENNVSLALFHFLQNCLQTFLKLASVLGSCYKRAHVQSKNLFVFQSFRNVSGNDSLSQSFNGCCFTDARLTDQNRIVLCLTGKNPDNVANLRITANYRVQLLVAGFFHQILSIFIKSIIGCFRVVADYPLISPYCGKRLKEAFSGDSKFIKNLLHAGARLLQKRQKQMLYRNVLVSHSSCFVFCADKRFIQVLSEPEISAAYLYPGIQGFFYCINKIFLIDLHLINKLENQAVLLTEKSIQKMLLLHFLIAVFIGNLFQILNSLYGFLCKFTDIHRLSSSICK